MAEILYRKENHRAYVTLNTPENLNAIGLIKTRELVKIWDDINQDNDVWVVILNGEGRSFCAGANVKEMKRGDWQLKNTWILGEERFLPSWRNVSKPIIAAVHNHVYGAGFGLCLEADMIVACEDARFGLPEGRSNIVTLFAPILSKYLPHHIAGELLYTGNPITAQRAYDIGLCNRIVTKDKLMSTAEDLAEQVCANGPLSLWASKKLYAAGKEVNNDKYSQMVEELALPIMNSEDSVEAKKAFIEKRKPVWKLK